MQDFEAGFLQTLAEFSVVAGGVEGTTDEMRGSGFVQKPWPMTVEHA